MGLKDLIYPKSQLTSDIPKLTSDIDSMNLLWLYESAGVDGVHGYLRSEMSPCGT